MNLKQTLEAAIAHVPPGLCEASSPVLAGAERVAAEINAYWRARGFDANARPERCGFHHAMRGAYYRVVSDIVNGKPPLRPQQQEEQAA